MWVWFDAYIMSVTLNGSFPTKMRSCRIILCRSKIYRDIIASKGLTEQMEDKTFEIMTQIYSSYQ